MTITTKEKHLPNNGIEIYQHAVVTFKFLTVHNLLLLIARQHTDARY